MVRRKLIILLFLLGFLSPSAVTLSNTSRKISVKIPVRYEKIKETIFTQKVAASVYFPSEGQTDDSPLITADGSRIDRKNVRKHRWIAVSRDLLRNKKIRYGDSVYVSGISEKLDGYYTVHDTMNKRLRNTIDILVGANDNIMGHWKNVRISRFKTVTVQR